MIEWYLENLKSWAVNNPDIVIFGCGTETKYLVQNHRITSYFTNISFCDNNPNIQNKKFCGNSVLPPSLLKRDVPVLIISSRHGAEIKNELLKKYRIKTAFCLLEDLMLPGKKKFFQTKDSGSHPGIKLLRQDLKNWDIFLQKESKDVSLDNHLFDDLRELLTDSQIYEIVQRKYFCRCFHCGKVNCSTTIFLDCHYYYICFKCEVCKNRWIRFQGIRVYNLPYIYIPLLDKIIAPYKSFSPTKTINAYKVECMNFLGDFIKRDYTRRLAGIKKTPLIDKNEKKKDILYIFTNRYISIWSNFLDEGVALWHFSRTAYAKKRTIVTLTAEWARGTSEYVCYDHISRRFRKDGMKHKESLDALNDYIQANKIFVFTPAIRDHFSNPLFNFNDNMRKDWFSRLESDINKLKNKYRNHFPILFFHVRPYQYRIWNGEKEKIPEFLSLFFDKYEKGLVILHGNSRCKEFFDKEVFWQKILNKKNVISCIDKTFKEQYLMNKISTLGVYYGGGGTVLPVLTKSPFIEMVNSNLFETSSINGEIIRNIPSKKANILDRSRYCLLVDYVTDKNDQDFYFEPELVLSAVSCMLENIKKRGN